MGTLIEDIKEQSNWIVKAFAADRLKLGYTIKSFIEIDKFFNKHTVDGKGRPGGRLSKGYGPILFSIGAYMGETIIKALPGSVWITDDNESDRELTVSVKLPGDILIWPMQRVMKRFKNGSEDSIYVYGHAITKEFTNEEFDERYWHITNSSKAWWKFW